MNEEHFPDKELAELWKRQETPMASMANPVELAASIKAEHRREQTRMIILNVRELIPSLFLFGFFGWIGLTEDSGRLALFASALLSIGVGLFLLGSSIRQHHSEQQFDTTLRGSIERSLSQARHRFRMYRTCGWWYFLPLYVAACIFGAWVVLVDDPNGAKVGDGVGMVLMALLFVGGYLLNRRIAFKKWKPEVERFEALLAEMGG